jgi:hypothetical protein
MEKLKLLREFAERMFQRPQMKKIRPLEKRAKELLSQQPKTGAEAIEFVKKIRDLNKEILLAIGPFYALPAKHRKYPDLDVTETLEDDIEILKNANINLLLSLGNDPKANSLKDFSKQIEQRIRPHLEEIFRDFRQTKFEFGSQVN